MFIYNDVVRIEPRLYPKSLWKYTKADIRITPTTTSKAFESDMENDLFQHVNLSRHLTNYVHGRNNAMEFLIYSIEINGY